MSATQTDNSVCLGILADSNMERLELEKKISEAKHSSKPDASNTVVLYDKIGDWVLEIYTKGHKVKVNDGVE